MKAILKSDDVQTLATVPAVDAFKELENAIEKGVTGLTRAVGDFIGIIQLIEAPSMHISSAIRWL